MLDFQHFSYVFYALQSSCLSDLRNYMLFFILLLVDQSTWLLFCYYDFTVSLYL